MFDGKFGTKASHKQPMLYLDIKDMTYSLTFDHNQIKHKRYVIEIKDFTNFVYNRKDSSIDFSMDEQPGNPEIDFKDANIFIKTP